MWRRPAYMSVSNDRSPGGGRAGTGRRAYEPVTAPAVITGRDGRPAALADLQPTPLPTYHTAYTKFLVKL